MADNPPISTEVPEIVSVDTGADKQSLGDLDKEFADFWKTQDAAPAEAPPAAPEALEQGPAQETKPEKAATLEPPKPPRQAEPKQPPQPEPKPEPKKQLSDEDIDKLELPHAAKPEFQANFKTLKEILKTERSAHKELAAAQDKLAADLAEARKNAWTPESRADYEHAASIRRRFDLASDPEFAAKYQTPINERFIQIMEEAVNVLPDRQAAQAWAKDIIEKFGPDRVHRQWWHNDVIAKVPNEMDRQSLLSSVNDLLRLQRERDTQLQRTSGDGNAFDAWIKEKTETTAKRVQEEIMAEIGEQEKLIAEVLPRDLEKAKTAEERSAFEAHNTRFKSLNDHFVSVMQDISKNGPRAWVRASVQATRAQLLQGQYDEVAKELESVRAERDQLKSELEKIHSARRRISQTSGTPPAQSSKKEGLSLKDLDVRKSFDSYNWDNT